MSAPTHDTRPSAVREKGSVLMLVPAGVLVLVLFGAIAVDSAAAYLGQRQLADALAASANDAATSAIGNPAYYRSGTIDLDPAAAARAVCESLSAQGDNGLLRLHVGIGVEGATITVEGTAWVRAVFGRHFPGFGERRVAAAATAVAEQGTGGTPGVAPTPVPVRC